MANPSINPLPQAPNRAMARTVYPVVADAWAAAIGPWTTQVNDVVTWMGKQVDAVATSVKSASDSATAAGQAVTDAQAQVKLATDQAQASKGSADSAAGSLASVKVVASAVDASAGLPPGVVPGSVLRQKLDGSGQKEWWQIVVNQVGDVIVSTQAPDSTWVPTGKSYPQSTWPALYTKLGVIADYPIGGASNGTTFGNFSGNNYQMTPPIYGNNVYVSAGTGGGFVIRSMDAFTTNTTIGISADQWVDGDYGNNVFVLLASNTVVGRSTDNGLNWASAASLPQQAQWRLRFGGGIFLGAALQPGNNSTSGAVVTSPDGVTWTSRSTPSAPLIKPAYGAGLFVCVFSDGVYTSPNGVTWTKRTSFPFAPSGSSQLEYALGAGFMLIDMPQKLGAFSVDGINWVAIAPPPSIGTSNCGLAAHQAGFLLQVVASNAWWSTTDGTKWTPRVGVSSGQIGKFIYANRTVVGWGAATPVTPVRVRAFSYDPATQFFTTDPAGAAQGLNQYIKAA